MTRRLLFVFTLVACGPHTAAPPAHEPGSSTPAPDDTWSKLSFEERHSAMTFTVLPNMARAWRDFRGTKDPEMTCRTCHGANAEAVSYRMPNPSLKPIDPARDPVARFMKEKMVPEMRELTGAPDLGCNTCHTIPVVTK
jgi:hypothetical protein